MADYDLVPTHSLKKIEKEISTLKESHKQSLLSPASIEKLVRTNESLQDSVSKLSLQVSELNNAFKNLNEIFKSVSKEEESENKLVAEIRNLIDTLGKNSSLLKTNSSTKDIKRPNFLSSYNNKFRRTRAQAKPYAYNR